MGRAGKGSFGEQRGREAKGHSCCHKFQEGEWIARRLSQSQPDVRLRRSQQFRFGFRHRATGCQEVQEQEWTSTSWRPTRCGRFQPESKAVRPSKGPRHGQGGEEFDDEGNDRRSKSQRVASLHDDVDDAGPEGEVQASQERTKRPGFPWWLLLRKFGIRRQRPQVRDACCDISSQAPEEDHPSPQVHSEGFRAPGGRRTGCGGGTMLDADGLCETSAVGQVSRDLPLCLHGRSSLRAPQRRSNRGRPGPIDPEPQGEDSERDSRWQLGDSMAVNWNSGSLESPGIRRLKGGDVSGVGVCQPVGQVEEACERSLPTRQRRRRRGGRGGPSVQVKPLPEEMMPGVLDPKLHGLNSSKFLAYMSWLESAHSTLPTKAGSNQCLFPCVLPYPEALESEGLSVVDEPKEMLFAKRHLNTLVAWCNYIILGCPDCRGGTFEPRVVHRCRDDARRFSDGLLGEAAKFGSSELVSGRLTMQSGRLAVEEMLKQMAKSVSGYHGGPTACNLSGAMAVVSERIAVPRMAGQVDPRDLLPEHQRVVVDDLPALRKPEHLWDEIPVPCHRVDSSQEAGLVKKLLECNMVKLVPEPELPRDQFGNFLSGGFFCVPKNEDEDRLIFDRRPENSTMDRVVWARLPSGACFNRMRLNPNQYVRGSGDDLRNFYYTLKLPDEWIKYNSVGSTIQASVVAAAGGDASVPHRMCLRVLGMGDCNACDIAQATHEAVLQSAGLLTENSKMVYGDPAPRGDVWEGAYLDDLLIACKIDMDEAIPLDGSFVPPVPSGEDIDLQKAAAAEKAYADAGLERAVHKSFRAQTLFKAWGAEIDGIQGVAGAPLLFRQQTWSLIQQVVLLGWCNKKILQKILGYVCFIFQFRREMYCLQHHIYKYIDGMGERWRRLPGFICDELRSIAFHLPFAKWNMRKVFSPFLLATDATPTSGGACVAQLPVPLADELWRCSEQCGEVVRLDENLLQKEMDRWSDPKEPSVFASTLGKTMEWTATAGYSFRETSHINLQETRALRREISRFASNSENRGQIQICLNDSRVVCGAVSKGRSSSYKLNGILRGMLPFLIFADITLALLWTETDSNPADHPSRGRPIPRPLSMPNWLKKYLGGVRSTGWEIFAGTCRLTKSHVECGVPMLDPVELLLGSNALDDWLDQVLLSGKVSWIWLAPPCGSFSPLRNLDKGGPLRPSGNPMGDEANPEIALGNHLWRRAIQLAWLCYKHGIYFMLEHPRDSKAWLLPETQKLWSQHGVFAVQLDWCMFDDHEREGLPNRKPTRILASAPWVHHVVRQCDHQHQHGPPLRGKRAKAAGAYPWEFCKNLAVACKHWW